MANKVVWIVNEYNGPEGEDTRQQFLAKYLKEKGYDVYLFSGSADHKGGKNYLDKGKRFVFLDKGIYKGYIIKTSNYHRNVERVFVSIQFQHRIWRLRKRFPKPDVIVSDFAGLFGNVFLRWKRRYATKIIYDVLDLWPEGFIEMGYIKKNSIVAKILYGLEHKSYRDADGIIFSMQGGRDYIIDKGWSKEFGGDVDTTNIGYLNNGIDLDTVDQEKTEYYLDDYDLDTAKFKVVYLGSISAMNGLDVLVETAKKLQDRGIEQIVFLVYGFGNQEERLKRMVADYGLTNIKFKGQLEKKYAMSLLSRSDLNVFTFRESPLWKYGVSPNKLFMYFASGKPVLSMIKPKYDLVESKKAGKSVLNNPEVIADAIEQFSSMDDTEYSMYCYNSRAIAEEYDYKNLVQVLIEKIEGAYK